MFRVAIGMVGWNVSTIKKKGVVAWAKEAYTLAPIKARQAAREADKLIRDRCFQATAASSVTGAVTLGTAGGVAGLAAGATVGAVGGGATGYTVYQRRDKIAAMLKSGRQELTRMTKQARQYARERISAVRRKFAGGSA